MANRREIHRKVIESQGSETSDLVGVLKQGMHHNAHNSYSLGITAESMSGGGIEGVKNSVTERSALVERHMRDAQNALEEMYQVAKERGYEDIIQIFEREYHVGKARSFNPNNN